MNRIFTSRAKPLLFGAAAVGITTIAIYIGQRYLPSTVSRRKTHRRSADSSPNANEEAPLTAPGQASLGPGTPSDIPVAVQPKALVLSSSTYESPPPADALLEPVMWLSDEPTAGSSGMARRSLRSEPPPAYKPKKKELVLSFDEPQLILSLNENKINVLFKRNIDKPIGTKQKECLDALSTLSAQAYSSIEVTAILDTEVMAWSLASLEKIAAGFETLRNGDVKERCKILTVKLPDDPAVLPIHDLPTNAFTLEAVQKLTWESHRNQLRYMLGWPEDTSIHPNLTTVNITCLMTMHDCTYILSALSPTLQDFDINYLMENGDMTLLAPLRSGRIQAHRELGTMVALTRLILRSELHPREMVNKFTYPALKEFKILKPDENANSIRRPEFDYHKMTDFNNIPWDQIESSNMR